MALRYWAAGIVGFAGCVGPEETRYLSYFQRAPDVESRSYDWHDPFPDEMVGPDTATRPRTFLEPRSDTRKNFDLRFLQAMHPTAGKTQFAAVPRGPARPGPNGTPIPTSPVAQYPFPATPVRQAYAPGTSVAAPMVMPAY